MLHQIAVHGQTDIKR